MNRKDYLDKVWSFYLRLEKDFVNTLNYVSFTEDNYGVYSIEFERLILSICSEIDVVMKLLCACYPDGNAADNIKNYYRILSANTDMLSVKVRFRDDENTYEPFANWTEEVSPLWWTSYNKIKHDRITNENYKKGNLINTFNSLAGLYSLNRYYCKEIGMSVLERDPFPKSEFFEMEGWDVIEPMGNGFYKNYRIDGSMGIYHE